VRPALRPVEIIRVPNGQGALVTVLRDPEAIAPHAVEVRAPLDAALGLFDGRRETAEIAKLLRGRGIRVTDSEVERLALDLEDAAYLVGPTARARKAAIARAYAAARTREATHAGGAYHGDPQALARFVETSCLGRAGGAKLDGEIVGLVAPHMDLWRAAVGYGHAYAALRDRMPKHLETVVVLGTCHAGLRSAFCMTRKGFATPLGELGVDGPMADELAAGAAEDVYEEELKHKGEHSIEFQCVFLRHLLGEERAARVRIVPILCGLGRPQVQRRDPAQDRVASRFLGTLGDALARRAGRVLVVAGADLAHVGPRFGDAAPLDEAGRHALERRDRESLDLAVALEAAPFFDHVTEDLYERRVCGTGPLYTLLRSMEALGAQRGRLLSYEQNVDPEEGSIVSHASVAYIGKA
jgi:hypothetical protein